MSGAGAVHARAVSAPPAGPRLKSHLTRRGKMVVGAAVVWVLVGLTLDLAAVVALGALPFVALTWGLAVGIGVRAQLGRAQVQVLPLVRDQEIRIKIGQVARIPLRVELSPGLRARAPELEAAAVEPTDSWIETQDDGYALMVRAPRVGTAWIAGFIIRARILRGLFVVHGWLPAPIRMKVLPRRFPLRNEVPLRATRAAVRDQAGALYSPRRGLGLEIRELRDHQAGDPFKHIAWRASARRGKLIVREFESDLVLSTWILVDASPSMFWGTPGQARIDFALDTANNLADIILGRGDRVGLIVHDHKVRLETKPGAGRRHLMRLVDMLIEVPHLLHEDRTEITDREVVERVARWFESQQGEHFRLPESLLVHADPRESGYDEARLVRSAGAALAELFAAGHRRRPIIPIEGYAHYFHRSTLRAFCRHMGVPVPLDPTPVPGGQTKGLEESIHHVLHTRTGPHTIIVISDFYTVDDHAALRRIAVAARRRSHNVIVFCPSDPAFDAAERSGDPLVDAIADAVRLRVDHNLAAAQATLRPAGVTFVRCGPSDVLPRLLHRLRQVA